MNDIKQKIVEANKAYRTGSPIMSDQDYDDLLESLKATMSEEEYEAFVATLNEGSIEKNMDGKVKHPFIMGSLEKLKAEEPEIVKKWIKENIVGQMSVSAKVDGISSRAEYRNGKLVSLTTRGDGYFGLGSYSRSMVYAKRADECAGVLCRSGRNSKEPQVFRHPEPQLDRCFDARLCVSLR